MQKIEEIPFFTKFNPPEPIITNELGPSKTDTSKQEQTDIYAIMAKYGVSHTRIQQMTKPEHELFIDTSILPKNMTFAEAVELKNKFKDYFQAAPAKFRKLFKDNPDEFYEAYRQGEYNMLINAGALTEEQINIQKNAIKAELQPIEDKIAKYEADLATERSKNERLNSLLDTQQNQTSGQTN